MNKWLTTWQEFERANLQNLKCSDVVQSEDVKVSTCVVKLGTDRYRTSYRDLLETTRLLDISGESGLPRRRYLPCGT